MYNQGSAPRPNDDKLKSYAQAEGLLCKRAEEVSILVTQEAQPFLDQSRHATTTKAYTTAPTDNGAGTGLQPLNCMLTVAKTNPF